MQTHVSRHGNNYFIESQIFSEFLEIILNLENFLHLELPYFSNVATTKQYFYFELFFGVTNAATIKEYFF